MQNFKIVNNASEVPFNTKWNFPTKFDSKDDVVDEKGCKFEANYQGRQYKIIAKREHTFSPIERLGRGLLGTLAVAFTFFLALASKSVRDLFTRSKESIHFGKEYDPSVKPDSSLPVPPPLLNSLSIKREDIENSHSIDIKAEASRFFFKEEEKSMVEEIRKHVDKTVGDYMTRSSHLENFSLNQIKLKGFTFPYEKHYQVLEHPAFSGWIMKGGGLRSFGDSIKNKAGSSSSNAYDHVMRVFMAERMSKVVEEDKLSVVIPEERLVLSGKIGGGLEENYYVFSKKLDVLDEIGTKEALKKLPEEQQRKVAGDLCQLIKKTGFMSANFNDIRWSPKLEKLAIMDTKSKGLLVEKNTPFLVEESTLMEKCVLIGLQELQDKIGKEFPIFAEEADKAMKEARKAILKV